MRCTIALLALVAFASAIPVIKQRAADQDTLKKQQDVISLLHHVTGKIPNEQLQALGTNYDIENSYHLYQNPIIVKYYVGCVKAGLVQPQGTPFSTSLSQLRKEVALLSQILVGANDYQTFLSTAAWARVHVNEVQFVKAFISAILRRPDTQGIIVPPTYEIFPQYHLDSRIIQEAQDLGAQGAQNVVIPVNYSAHLPHGEHQLNYFTQDIGLANYYNFVNLAGYLLEHGQSPAYQQPGVGQFKQQSVQDQQGSIGHGSHYYYLHQQLLAHYELNRLSNGLGPIPDVDFEKIEAPYQPHFRHLNGLEFPGRPHILEQPHHNHQFVQKVQNLQQRLVDAIDAGHVITPQGIFLSLYQPQGLNILGELIEGTGKSVNPLYYGSFQAVARKLLGNAPEVQNIWDYTPSVLEISETAVHDPAFFQLYKQVIGLFQQYQSALPPHQYSDLVLDGVSIQNVDISQLSTVFSDFYVSLDSVTGQPEHHQPESHHIKAHLKRLDHQPYQYQITVQSEQIVPGAVVRVYLGPKFNYEGKPISISQHRHLFVELDQFVHDLQQGQNTIVRHSQQAPTKSHDHPSIDEIQQHVEDAIRSQEPLYITEPHQIFGFPARLSLPKGQQQGFPLQLLVVISGPGQQQVSYGPVIPEEYQDFQSQHFQIVDADDFHGQQPQVQHLPGVQQYVEVLPEKLVVDQQQIPAVRSHYADLYTKHHGHYPYPQSQIAIGQGVQPLGIQHYGQYYQGQQWQQYHQGQQWQQQQHQQQHQQHQQQQQPGQQQLPQYQQGQQQGQQQVPQGQQYVGQKQQYEFQQPIFHGQQQQPQQQQQHQQQQPIQQQQHQFQGQQQVPYQQQPFHIPQQVPIAKPVQFGVHGVQGVQQPEVQVMQGVYQTPQGPIVGGGQQHFGGYQGIYGQGQIVQDQIVNDYYQGKHISEIIGGAISLDGKPLGFPLDRPLTPGALSVPNIYVKDVFIYHQGQPTNEVSQ